MLLRASPKIQDHACEAYPKVTDIAQTILTHPLSKFEITDKKEQAGRHVTYLTINCMKVAAHEVTRRKQADTRYVRVSKNTSTFKSNDN